MWRLVDEAGGGQQSPALLARVQRMLPAHGDGDLFRPPARTRLYCIRPFCPEDQVSTHLPAFAPSAWLFSTRVPSESAGRPVQGGECRHAAPLSGVRRHLGACALARRLSSGCSLWSALSLLGGELRPSPGCALLLDDDAGLCGCALALLDAKEAAAKSQVSRRSFRRSSGCVGGVYRSASVHQRAGSPSVLEEFPSLVSMRLLPRVTDFSPVERLMSQLLSSLRSAGTFGSS